MQRNTLIYREILKCKERGVPSALAILVRCEGSSPQKEGAKLLVRADGSTAGTVGGGALEEEVIAAGRRVMQQGTPSTLSFELTEAHGHACGGRVLVYVEPILLDPHLVILGAGHIGRALSTLARFVGFRVTVADDRPEYANREYLPNADEVVISDFSHVFSKVSTDEHTYVLIATRGHEHDQEAATAALGTDAAYVGLVGSSRKRSALATKLRQRGFSERDIERVRTPAGLAIGSVTPEEIAVSIIAQIIQHRRGHDA